MAKLLVAVGVLMAALVCHVPTTFAGQGGDFVTVETDSGWK